MNYWRTGRVLRLTRTFFAEYWPSKPPWNHCIITYRHISCGSSNCAESWTQRIRSAVISLLPPDQQADFKDRIENQKSNRLIASNIKFSGSLNEDFYHAVENLPKPFKSRGIPLSTILSNIMEYYPQFRGRLPENIAVLLSISLYHDQKYIQSVRILLENLSLGDSFFSAFCTKLIPELASIHGYDFVVGNLVRAFVLLNQTNTISQLLLELGESEKEIAERIRDANVIIGLDKYVTVQSSEEFISSAMRGPVVRGSVVNSTTVEGPAVSNLAVNSSTVSSPGPAIIGPGPAVSSGGPAISTPKTPRLPQLYSSLDINIDTRLNIFCHFTRIDSNKTMEHLFSKLNSKRNFLSQPFVLHNFILKMKRHDWWKSNTNFTDFLHLFDKWYFEYHSVDLQSLAYIPCDNRQFSRIFRVYKKYHKKRSKSLTNQENNEILDMFLFYAIKHGQTLTVTDVVKLGAYNDPLLVSEAIDTVIWGKTNSCKSTNDQALYVEKAADDALLHRIFAAVPNTVLEKALVLSMNRLAHRGPPGKILWDFLSAISSYPGIQRLPPQLERTAAIAISSRPHFEQMRYMALEKVSPAGIVANLNQFIARVKSSHDDKDVFDSDLKLILVSLMLLNERTGRLAVSDGGLVHSDKMANAITNLFHQWDDHKAMEVMEFLVQKNIRIPEQAVLLSAAILVKRKQFNLANQLLESVPNIPTSSFHGFLIKISRNWPFLCKNFMEWLRITRQLPIPSGIIRKIIIGYCQNSRLTSAQCNNRIIPLIGILRFRKQPVGKRTAIAIVEGIIRRVDYSGKGSRTRLLWAIDLAKSEEVPKEQINGWIRTVRLMKLRNRGFWSNSRN